jgi:hypothetical protein
LEQIMLKFSTGLKNQMLGAIKGAVPATYSLEHGVARLYTGSQPASADNAATGTLLVQFTVGSGAFTAGVATNGLTFEVTAGVIRKFSDENSSEIWSGIGLADGTAGWIRFCGNAEDDGGASTTLPRIDCRVSTSGAECNLPNLAIVTGATVTLDSFSAAFPSTL